MVLLKFFEIKAGFITKIKKPSLYIRKPSVIILYAAVKYFLLKVQYR